MNTTFVMFEDMKIKIIRPEKIKERDKDICNRAHELLKGVKEEDDWTKEMDELFKKHNIKYEIADEKEFNEFMKMANELNLRV